VKIFVALQSFGEYDATPLKLLDKVGVEVIYNKLGHRLNQDEIIELGKDSDGVVAGVEPYDAKVLNNMSSLKCISRCGVGMDNVDLELAKAKGIAVLNTPDVVVQPVAEMSVAMIFDLLRKLTLHTASLKRGKWEKYSGHLLAGRRVGIVGLGKIGKRVAQMLQALGAEVWGADLYPDCAWAKKEGIKIIELPEVLKSADILSIHVSVVKHDSFFLGLDQISAMKKGALVINTSRGQVIDEEALYAALKSGKLAGAGLDVFSQEPYNGPLCELDNVVLTPHISTLTEESRSEMEKEAVENILRFFGLLK
jgi:D-3-phosphoglycerate dehydrogenase